ncbi:hypothetical protein BGZ96_007011 [Linnemannia gamsii]|uniref:Uncharacterized protein n=1 Tax=Linnemannia gamsii TaxID=64522 RepID=A0ABQ7K2A1_9FUNG|nr:hypothetical protein BGZ96_007011 [Linnemannia gamsii]
MSHPLGVSLDFAPLPSADVSNLIDMLTEYTSDEVEYWKPAELPLLKYLNLMGKSAFSFHPDTLKSTPELTRLSLGTCTSISSDPFIPPPESFVRTDADVDDFDGTLTTMAAPNPRRRRPIWTWDWELPKLTMLRLNSEFGYTFRFGMLASTPSLESLDVHIWPRSQDLHRRTIHLAVLRLPKSGSKTRHPPLHVSDEEKEEVEYIHAPTLRSLTLGGPWTSIAK